MPKVTTIKAHRYAGKARSPGDSYEVRGNGNLRLIKAMGWAIEAPPAPTPVPAAAARAVVSVYRGAPRPEAPPAPVVVGESAPYVKPAAKRANYKRRDMTAEGADESAAE